MRRLGLFLAAVFACAGCGGPSSPGARPPADGGTLRIGQTVEPHSLDPLLEEGTVVEQIDALAFSFLVTVDPHGKLLPDAAREVPTRANGGISADGLRITYHLRSGIRWQDGVPLTARDCAFTFRAIENPRNNLPTRAGYEFVRDVSAPNATTVVVTLARPYAPIVDAFLAPDFNYPILPEHLLARYPDVNRIPYNELPIGSGPFRVTQWKHGDAITFVRNDAYFGGRPKLARIDVRFEPSSETLVNQLQTHEIDAAFAIPPVHVRQVRAIPGLRVLTTPYAAVSLVYLNAVAGPTRDVVVRRAIETALDLPRLVHDGTQGVDDAKDAMAGLFAWAYRHVPDPAYDPAAAERMLDADGWRRGPDGVRVKAGERLALTLIASTASSTAYTTGIQQALQRIGVELTIKIFNPTEYRAPASAGGPVFGQKFSLALFDIYVGAGDPDVLPYFGCSERAPHGFNLGGFCDPAMEAAAQDGVRTYDVARRVRDYGIVERVMRDRVPVIVLAQIRTLDAFDTTLSGVTESTYTSYFEVQRWAK